MAYLVQALTRPLKSVSSSHPHDSPCIGDVIFPISYKRELLLSNVLKVMELVSKESGILQSLSSSKAQAVHAVLSSLPQGQHLETLTRHVSCTNCLSLWDQLPPV